MEPRDAGVIARRPVTAGRATGLVLRLVVTLGVAAVAGLAVDRGLASLVPDVGPIAHITGLTAAAATAALLVSLAVRPLVRSHVELEVRYEAALADALTDQLTGLGNHRAFQEELDRQVELARRYEVPLALILIDLDEFKTVNDTNGHAAGDRILRGLGQLLSSGARRADRPFRVGGDEFALLLPHTDAQGARILARRLLALALQPPLREEDLQAVSFSAGISAVPELADGRAQLYSQADAALYAAKRGGRTDVAIYDPTAEAPLSDESAWAAIAEVIARGQLRPVYQPIVDLTTGRVLGVEGLIRPSGTIAFDGPASLFAAAEASGRLTALDLACMETIVAGARRLPADQFLSVNLSPQTVEAGEFNANAVLAVLARHRLAPERLVIELTEHQPLVNPDRVRRKLEACRTAGIRFAADDIGAGNAGLRLLAEIRFEVLKIDLSLVRGSAPGALPSAVVGSVIDLASRTGALVVAEGVEHQAELAQLSALGVSAAQGFYFGRPGPLVVADETPADAAGSISAWRQSIGLPSPAA
jgi:diguanylate cyclase (GGDEF)-like protein